MDFSNGMQDIAATMPQNIGIQHGAQDVSQVTPLLTRFQVIS